MSEAITCRGLRKSFGAVVAVDGIDLTVERGSVTTLLGPSGCGKTTVLRLIAGFERPDGGSIAVSGRPVSDTGVFVPPEKRRVGMVFQDYALFPHLDVAGNIGYGLARGPERPGRIGEVLQLVGLQGLQSRMPHELSGGQQQRVALARALAPKPDIVLMDEPFSNLDARLRARVRGEVRDILRAAGATAIFVTHDQEEALSLSDAVAMMVGGRLLQTGTPEDLYRRPASREVADFVGDADFLAGKASGHRVETAIGVLALETAADGEVDVLVRPEWVRLKVEERANGSAPGGAAAGEVIGRAFYGRDQVVTVGLPSGVVVHARCGSGDVYPAGAAVTVRVEGSVTAFPRRRSEAGSDVRSGGGPRA